MTELPRDTRAALAALQAEQQRQAAEIAALRAEFAALKPTPPATDGWRPGRVDPAEEREGATVHVLAIAPAQNTEPVDELREKFAAVLRDHPEIETARPHHEPLDRWKRDTLADFLIAHRWLGTFYRTAKADETRGLAAWNDIIFNRMVDAGEQPQNLSGLATLAAGLALGVAEVREPIAYSRFHLSRTPPAPAAKRLAEQGAPIIVGPGDEARRLANGAEPAGWSPGRLEQRNRAVG
jgi:hypothetical protein